MPDRSRLPWPAATARIIFLNETLLISDVIWASMTIHFFLITFCSYHGSLLMSSGGVKFIIAFRLSSLLISDVIWGSRYNYLYNTRSVLTIDNNSWFNVKVINNYIYYQVLFLNHFLFLMLLGGPNDDTTRFGKLVIVLNAPLLLDMLEPHSTCH